MADTPKNTEPTQPDINGTWKDPYSRDVLLPPELIEQLRAKIGQQSDADKKAAELKAQGYKTYTEAEQITDIPQKNISYRANNFDPQQDYLPTGLLPPPGYEGRVVKGNKIRW